ncbi:twin-arginine translocase TatA/TatE family subunit [Proteinivorax hydrogeniformans]|uniref:Sec-independent protein translocase protein TatA n=1 Tax=Proteinivorax hydrogeniformans TaxID=1826727 RepID=A0AAU8HRA7_9FIRM
MFRLGPMELTLILGIALVIFGPAKLPEIGKALGKGIKEFKDQSQGFTSDQQATVNNNKEK